MGERWRDHHALLNSQFVFSRPFQADLTSTKRDTMRCWYMMLLVAVALFSSRNSAVTATGSWLSIRDEVNPPSSRTLRIERKSSDNDDERAWYDFVPKLLLTDAQISQLAKETAPADDVFKKLKLDKLVKVDDKLNKVDNGLSRVLVNPNLQQFGNYLVKAEAKNPAEEMIVALSKQYGDDAVAKMLFDAKNQYTGDTKKFAENLQATQFIKWFNDNKKMIDVWDMLKLTHLTWYTNRYHQIWWDYLAAFVLLTVKTKH